LKLVPLTALVICALAAAISAQAANSATVLKLVAVQQSQKDISNGFMFTDIDLIGGKRAGRDTATCKLASQQKANCNILFQLSGGTIKAKLVILFSKPSGTGTITGGSGKYAGAKGKLTFRNLNEKGTRTAVVLTFV
jgi:hypothetical protein